MKRWGCLVCSIAILLLFLAFIGVAVPLEFVVFLAIGWLLFLAKVVPQLSVSWSGVTTAAVALALFVVGFQRLATWCFSAVGGTGEQTLQRTWQWRWTFLTAAAILLSFIAGIAVVGGVHQVVWMASSDRPLTRNYTAIDFHRTLSRNNLRAVGLALGQYHDAHRQLPAGGTFDRLGRPLVSWQTALLPFIGQSDLYARMRLDLP